MRDPSRIPIILGLVEKKWKQHPDMRLGQLMMMFAHLHNGAKDCFYMEDDAIIALFEKFEGEENGEEI